jgi:hypothetical protein
MADRIFGMDTMDEHAAINHALGMWERHKDALIKA